MKTLTISIATSDNKELILGCLRSIYDTAVDIDLDINVAVNPCSDGSVEAIRGYFPGVNLIVNERNRGFTSNHNMVLRKAKGDYVLVLNDDVLVLEGTLNRMIDYMDGHP